MRWIIGIDLILLAAFVSLGGPDQGMLPALQLLLAAFGTLCAAAVIIGIFRAAHSGHPSPQRPSNDAA